MTDQFQLIPKWDNKRYDKSESELIESNSSEKVSNNPLSSRTGSLPSDPN